jgi:hypothetical protein
MAIRTDDLTARHFSPDPLERIALVHERGDPGRLPGDVVELQDQWVSKATVGAARRRQHPEYELPRLYPSAFARCVGLPAVQLSTLAYVVRSAPLAPRLAGMEIGQRKVFLATAASPHLGRPGWRRRLLGCRRRRSDVTCPDTCRGEGDSEFARDRSHRPSFGAKSARVTLLGVLPGGHTNKCSLEGWT